MMIFSSDAVAGKGIQPTPTPQMPFTEPTVRNSENNGYALGGIAGTLVGFGLGQAIQERYSPTGLIFTTSEAVALTMFFVGAQHIDNPGDRSGAGALAPVGFFAFIGLRIWEILDVWVAPNSSHQNFKNQAEQSHKPSLGMVPLVIKSNGVQDTGLALQWHF